MVTGAHLALAQTSAVVHLAVQSGNGQVSCICFTATLQQFQPISVKATDANGNPVANATVTWTDLSGQLNMGAATTTTDGTGVATEPFTFTVFNNFTSTGIPYDIFNIQASSNNQSVTFTETQSLVTSQGASVIAANSPQFAGALLADANLTANVGTTLATPIQTMVAGLNTASNGVPNVSIRIFNLQSSPQLTCAYVGGYSDPGSVLSDAHGNTSCYPVFSGSGSGSFYVLVGGVPGAGDIATALYLQAYGPYNFTSNPGVPASFQIVSGNNQVGSIGQLLNPLVAKLVDANGNPVQGKTVTWTVVPAGAVGLTNGNTVTDNNGQVTQSVSLDLLASAGAAITVSLQSNPSISATFQETVQGALTALNKISGDKQTAQVGTAYAAPLVVQVVNSNGPVANYPVQYLVSGPVSLSSSTAGTNANGQASVTALAGTLVGTATVTAIAGSLTASFTLTVSSTPTGPSPNGLTIISGSNQSAMPGAQFGQPLVVQVNSASGPISGYTVNFSTTGPVSLSTAAAVTNSSGQASINVSAGNAAGAGTVTAAITGYQAVYNLTVTSPGPQITAASFLNAASRQQGQLSPCGLAIVTGAGLTPDGISDYTLAPIVGRYPKTVHNLSITFGGIAAPIVSVAMGATNPEVTLQVPCEVAPASSVPVVVTVNGGGTATANIPIYAVSPGIFQQVMSDGVSRAVAVRADGTFADIGGSTSYDPTNPVRLGEEVRFYVTGLGATSPQSVTDTIEDPSSYLFQVENDVTGTMAAGLPGTGVLLQNVSAHQAPGLIGVYEVMATIPSGAPTGSNIPLYIGITPAGSSTITWSPNSSIPIGQ
jgi:uncharacterized protein (TIGR03437 family)